MDDVALTRRLCEILGGIPGWAWSLDRPYTAAEVGVFYGAIRSSPDTAVGVRMYGATDDRTRSYSWRRVQLRFRGAQHRPDGADALAAAAFGALQGLSRVDGISGIDRQSIAPLGADGNSREERTDNYIVLLDNKEASQP